MNVNKYVYIYIKAVTPETDAEFDSHDFFDITSTDVSLGFTMYRVDTTFKKTMPASISKQAHGNL